MFGASFIHERRLFLMPKETEEKIIAVGKARYWWAVLYPENMIEDWEALLPEILQLPFAYCIHDDDLEKEFEDQTQQKRKTHMHLMVAFSNTTTYKHVMEILSLLNAPGKKAFNKVEAIRGVRHAYEYLIHNTEASKRDGKKRYEPKERITGNNFDIGAYEQISSSDKLKMSKDICNYIVEHDICNFADLYMAVISCFDDNYFEILQTYSGFYERLIKGNYHKLQQSYDNMEEEYTSENDSFEGENAKNLCPSQAHAYAHAYENTLVFCPDCGSVEVVKNGKTRANTQVFKCKACGKKFTVSET